jgi:hypothetical protein
VGSVLLAVAVVGILAWFTATPALAAGPVVTKYYTDVVPCQVAVFPHL